MRYAVALFFTVFVLACSEVPENSSEEKLDRNQAPDATQAQPDTRSRPFNPGGGDSRLTLSRYFTLLYQDLGGAQPTPEQLNSAMGQYRSGRSIHDIVSGIVTTDLSNAQNQAKEAVEGGRGARLGWNYRGYRWWDVFSYYYLFSRPSYYSWNSSWTWRDYLPFFLTTRQYTDYLLYSYLLR